MSVVVPRRSNATLQFFKMWQGVCLSPHSLHAADRLSFLCYRDRFVLCGNASLVALRANFICADGNDYVVLAHKAAASW